ncbi:PhzF family phenazine biosynthesis protein [Mycoplasma sp. P36-A1]|uniref:PhzF family phenazine biosynthesis protein n=1 Tax=Mycoplasma sp. P36-A1 TaxID=3252900 RepID=UPI003C2E3EB4
MILYEVSAFTRNGVGGNLAGVVLEHKLNNDEMQEIAFKAAYSETIFLTMLENNIYKVQYFTPTEQIDFCGHASLAAAYLLFKNNQDCNKIEFITNNDNIFIEMINQKIYMKMPTINYLTNLDKKEIQNIFKIEEHNIINNPKIVETGIADVMVRVDSLKTLQNLDINFEKIKQYSNKLNVTGIHVLAISKGKYYVRNFAPAVGINEESATGTSNAGMYAYLLFTNTITIDDEVSFLQGDLLDQPSTIKATYHNDNIWISGECSIKNSLKL